MFDNETSEQLSERELQVLEMMATGASNQQIAHHLVISINTVKVHIRNIFGKLGVQSRTEATLRAIQEGWIVVPENSTAEISEAAPAPKQSYLLPRDVRPELAQWQQAYLALATLLALALVVVPLLPRGRIRERTDLPVIYAQPVTPTPPVLLNPNDWAPQAPMSTSRAGLGLVAFEQRIFAIGGIRGTDSSVTRLVEIYNPLTNKWTEGDNKPTAVRDIAGAALDDKIYVPGGCTNQGQAIDALEIYNPETDSWTQGPTLPEGRCGYGLAALRNRLYLFGGWNGQDYVDTVFVFSREDNEWQVMDSKMPQASGYVGATVLNDVIYVVGGYNGQDEFNQTYIFVPETGEWLEKAPLQERRGGLGLIGINGNLYAIGGGWETTLTMGEKYDPATDAWTTFETPFTNQWRNLGLTAIDTKIYAAGGWDGTEEAYMDALVSYQLLYQIFLPAVSGNK